MKFETLIYLTLFLFFTGQPKITYGQLDIFSILEVVDLFFGFQGEPRAVDTKFTPYPYSDLYKDGRYRPLYEPGRNISTKAQLILNSNSTGFVVVPQIQFSPISLITLDLNHRQIFIGDDLSNARKTGISNFSFQYNRLRNQRFNLWWDLGVSRYEEEDESDWGISYGLGFSLFVTRPLSFHLNYRFHDILEQGVLGLSTFNMSLQLHIDRYFISGGYQNLANRIFSNTWLFGGGVYF